LTRLDPTPGDLAGAGTERGSENPQPTKAELIHLLCWHLDRYDRLRASTASRASVVLSAGTILFAGNAVVLSQVVGVTSAPAGHWLPVLLSTGAIGSCSLVVLSLIRASGVLVASRESRTVLRAMGELPIAPVFNGTDTVRLIGSFAHFKGIVEGQRADDILEAAQVELWIDIQQHRRRYVRLRSAVLLLRLAAVAFLVVLAGLLVADLLSRF
jgi:hypothetical protein